MSLLLYSGTTKLKDIADASLYLILILPDLPELMSEVLMFISLFELTALMEVMLIG
mgnify:FL=1